jgi:hypothetical protein
MVYKFGKFKNKPCYAASYILLFELKLCLSFFVPFFCDALTIKDFVVQDCPSVPIGRSPRTDVLLKVENVVLEAGGCVLRLAGLYISLNSAYLFFQMQPL